MVHQAKEWLQPISSVKEKYEAYIDNISFLNCEWLFSKQEYIDSYKHLSKPSCPILWITGIPGVGRTQIAARVVQKLREDRRTVAYFFYGRGTLTSGDTRSVIFTLCWQLLNQFPEDVELLSEVCNKGGEPTETEIQDCLQRMCERRRAIILLEGLEERYPNEKGRRNFCHFLASLNRVCNIIIFGEEIGDVKRGLSDRDAITHISDCGADFWNEIERIPVREGAGFGASDETTRRGVDAKSGSHEGIGEQSIHFPMSKKDQFRVYAMLRRREKGPDLPGCVARQIIDQAEYWIKSTFESHERLENNGEKTKRTIPYLLSAPLGLARHAPIRKIFVTCRHDQVWREYPDKSGIYGDYSKYFDLILQKPNGSMSTFWRRSRRRPGPRHPFRRLIQSGLRDVQSEHVQSGDIQSGYRLGVIPKAITPGWVNFVETMRIEISSTFFPSEESWYGQASRKSQAKLERMKILTRMKNPAKQTTSLTDDSVKTEQKPPDAHYEKNLQMISWAGHPMPLPEEQNVPLPLSTDGKFSDPELSLRNPGSSASSYCEDADQLERTPISTTPNDLNEETPSDHADRKDENVRSSISIAFVQMIRELLRPGVRPGYKRLEWTCVSRLLQPSTTYTHLHDRLADSRSTVISKKRHLGLLINLPPD
jgi:hypothetical protein